MSLMTQIVLLLVTAAPASLMSYLALRSSRAAAREQANAKRDAAKASAEPGNQGALNEGFKTLLVERGQEIVQLRKDVAQANRTAQSAEHLAEKADENSDLAERRARAAEDRAARADKALEESQLAKKLLRENQQILLEALRRQQEWQRVYYEHLEAKNDIPPPPALDVSSFQIAIDGTKEGG